jgi:hypothetical protein
MRAYIDTTLLSYLIYHVLKKTGQTVNEDSMLSTLRHVFINEAERVEKEEGLLLADLGTFEFNFGGMILQASIYTDEFGSFITLEATKFPFQAAVHCVLFKDSFNQDLYFTLNGVVYDKFSLESEHYVSTYSTVRIEPEVMTFAKTEKVFDLSLKFFNKDVGYGFNIANIVNQSKRNRTLTLPKTCVKLHEKTVKAGQLPGIQLLDYREYIGALTFKNEIVEHLKNEVK